MIGSECWRKVTELQQATKTCWLLFANCTEKVLRNAFSVLRLQVFEYGFVGLVEGRKLVQLVHGPHSFLSMDSVEAAPVAVRTEGHAGEPLALLDLMALAGAGRPAHHAVHLLDPRDVLPLQCGGGLLIFALHLTCRCRSQTSARTLAHP